MNDINEIVIRARAEKLAEAYQEAIIRQDKTAKNNPHKQVSKAFVALCAHVHLGIDMPSAFASITDGPADLAIDAVHRGDVVNNQFRVVVFQGKLSTKKTSGGFPANEISKIVETLGYLFDPSAPLEANPSLTTIATEIRSLIVDGNIPNVEVVLCSNGRKWAADGQAIIDRCTAVPVGEWHFLNHDKLILSLTTQKQVDETLHVRGRPMVDDVEYSRVLVGKVNVQEIAGLFNRHGLNLLEQNVRHYLGLQNRVNKAIAKTLRDPETRSRFYFLNNGLTLICDRFDYFAGMEHPPVQIKGLQVVNGGQTCVTIMRVLESLPDDDFSAAFVPIRLYQLPGQQREEMVQQITQATNSQSPVELRDLHANDPIQLLLDDGLESLGYVYRRKRQETTEYLPSDIRITEAAEAVMAVWRQKPHVARFRKSALFGQYYDEIFTSTLEPAQVVLAVEIYRAVARATIGFSTNGIVARFYEYATHFVSMLVGARLLSEADLQLGDVKANFEQLLERLRRRDAQLVLLAAHEVLMALLLVGVNPRDDSLQRLSAAFRRGDLLEVLPKVRELAPSDFSDLPMDGESLSFDVDQVRAYIEQHSPDEYFQTSAAWILNTLDNALAE